MANEILIRFKPDGHDTLIKAINQLAAAQKKLERVTNSSTQAQKKAKAQSSKLNSTVLNLTAKIGAQNKTWRDLGVSQKIVSQAMRGNQIAVEKLKNSYRKFDTTTRVLGGSFAVLRSKLLLASFAMTIVSQTVLRLVNMFAEQELAERRLSVALGRTSQGLLDQATALQKVTTFGDEAIIGAQALIAAFVKDEEQIKLVTKATLDLAAAKGMDLKTAADLMAKSVGSSTNALSRYGIEASGVAGSTERLESIVRNTQKLYGGFAEGELDTVRGQMLATKNAVGDAAEAFGYLLSYAVMPLAKVLKVVAEFINPSRLLAYGSAAVIAAIATGKFAGSLTWVNAQLKLLRANLLRSGIGIGIVVIGELAYQLGSLGGSAENTNGVIREEIDLWDELAKKLDPVGHALKEQEEARINLEHISQENRVSLQKEVELLHLTVNSLGLVSRQHRIFIKHQEEKINLGRELSEAEYKLIARLVDLEIKQEEYNKQISENNKRTRDAANAQREYQKALELSKKKVESYQLSITGLSRTLENMVLEAMKLEGFTVTDTILSPSEMVKYQKRIKLFGDMTKEGFDFEESLRTATSAPEEFLKKLSDEGISLTDAFAMGWRNVEDITAGVFKNIDVYTFTDVLSGMVDQQLITEKIIDTQIRLNEAVKKSEDAEEFRKNTAIRIKSTREYDDALTKQGKTEELSNDLRNANSNAQKEDLVLAHRRIIAEGEKTSASQALIDIQAKVTDGTITQSEAEQILLELMVEYANLELELIDIGEQELALKMRRVDETERETKVTEALAKSKRDAHFEAVKNSLALAKELTKNEKKQKDIAFALAMVDAVQVGLGTWRNLTDLKMPPPIPEIFAGIEFAAAAAMAANIRKYEQGGIIGGRRHSQGGTLIEAERGEFIMNRRAVESIGADNLSRMNQGGGAINVNVTGNVLSSDFVEGELADKISEAVRKGVDFGMS